MVVAFLFVITMIANLHISIASSRLWQHINLPIIFRQKLALQVSSFFTVKRLDRLSVHFQKME